MHVDLVTQGLGRTPSLLEPLRRLEVKALASTFLTTDEFMSLGVEPASGAETAGTARTPEPEWQAGDGAALPRTEPRRRDDERRLMVQELEATRRDRDAWRERCGHAEARPTLEPELRAMQRDGDAWRERADAAEARIAHSLTGRVKRTLFKLVGRSRR